MIDMHADEIEQFLEQARIGRLGMTDLRGRPYIVPLPFCWTGGALYLRLRLTGRKGKILGQNSRVCFETDAFTDTLDEYASVLIEGRLIPVTDLAEKAAVKRVNDEKYLRLRRGYRPGHGRSGSLEELPLRKIVVEQISGRRKSPEHSAAQLTGTTT